MSGPVVIATLLALLASVSGKIFEIYHRDHFHDYLSDLPAGSRFASVIAFYNGTTECGDSLRRLLWTEDDLPSTEHLLMGQMEMSKARDRMWYVAVM